MSGSHRGGDDRTDSYRGPGGGRGDGPRADGGEYGMGGSGGHAPYSGQTGRPPGTPGGPAGTGGHPATGGHPQAGASGGYPQSGESGAYGADSGRYSTGGYGSDSGRYAASGYDSGRYSTGGYGADSGRYSASGYPQASASASGGSGAYGSDSGRYTAGSGGYGGDPGRSASGGHPQSGAYGAYGASGAETDRYATSGYSQSGASGASGGHGADSGRSYATGSSRESGDLLGGSPRDSPRRSGGHRTGSGSHRVVREERKRRRWGLVLGAAVVGIAACVLAVLVVVSSGGSEGGEGANRIVGSGTSESAAAETGERSLVPDSCTIVGTGLIDKLAPNAAQNEADTYQGNDRQTQCVWGVYTGDEKRQLTIELRAVEAAGGKTATATATAMFEEERKADEAGEALLGGQKLAEKRRLDAVGDQGYVVYSVDDAQGTGEAIANVRSVNALITIHYAGSDGGDPLSYERASGGAVEVIEAVLAKLEAS